MSQRDQDRQDQIRRDAVQHRIADALENASPARVPCLSCGDPCPKVGPLCMLCVRKAILDRNERRAARGVVVKRCAELLLAHLEKVCVHPSDPKMVLLNPSIGDLANGHALIERIRKEIAEFASK
jgi:hypothetical protein